MARDAQDVGKQTIMRRFVEARAARPTQMMIDKKLFMTHTKTVKMQR